MKPTPETNRSVKDLAKGLQGKIVFQAPPGTNRPLTRSQSKAAQNNQTHTNKQNSLVSGPVFTAPMPERNFLEKTPSVSALQNELLSQNLSRTPSPKGKEVKEEITANTTRRPSPPSQATRSLGSSINSLPSLTSKADIIKSSVSINIEEILIQFLSSLTQKLDCPTPLLDQQYLSVIHDVEEYLGTDWKKNKELSQQINNIFYQSIRFGGSEMSEVVNDKRTAFLGVRKPFFPPNEDILLTPNKFQFYSSFPILSKLEQAKRGTPKNITNAIAITRDLGELLESLEEYSDVQLLKSLSFKDFIEVMNSYHFILRYENDTRKTEKQKKEKKIDIRRKLLSLEIKLILSSPNNIKEFTFPENNVNTAENMKAITQFEKFIDKFFFSGDFFASSLMYKNLLLFIQRLQAYYRVKFPPKDIRIKELDEVARKVFSKFGHSHLGTYNGVEFQRNCWEQKLIEIRKNFNSDMNSNDFTKWNDMLIDLLKDMVNEIEDELTTPFKFAVLVIGSIARREASFYSDIDLVIVVDDSYAHSEQQIAYFKSFVLLLRLVFMNLGESCPDAPVNHRFEPPAPKKVGIHVDPNFFPEIADQRKDNKCFGTATEVINYMKNKEELMLCDLGSIQDVILLNKTNGAQQVYENFIKERNKISSANRDLVIPYFKDLDNFKLSSSHFLKESINIKDISRYIGLLMNRLLIYIFKTERTDLLETEKKINFISEVSRKLEESARKQSLSVFDFIKQQGKMELFIFIFFCDENAKKIKEFINFLLELKFKCHLSYKEGKDDAYFKPKGNENRYVLNPDEVKYLKKSQKEILAPLDSVVEVWRNLVCEDAWSVKSAIECSVIFSNHASELMAISQEQKDPELLERANWYYEKSVELDLAGSRKRWIATILLSLTGFQDKMQLQLVFNEETVETINLSKEFIDQYEDPTRKVQEGRRTITKISINGNHFHIKEYPEAPSIDFAVSALSHLLLGYTNTPFSILAKLKRTKDDQTEIIPVLISRTVFGEPIQDKELKTVDSESFGICLIRTLLTNPTNDQPYNFILQSTLSPTNERKVRMFSVDNGHGFASQSTQTHSSVLFSEKIQLREKIGSLS